MQRLILIRQSDNTSGPKTLTLTLSLFFSYLAYQTRSDARACRPAAAPGRRHLFGVEADFIRAGQRGFDPLVSDESCHDVPQHVDPGLRTQPHPPGHPAVGDQRRQREAHLVRFDPPATRERDTEPHRRARGVRGEAGSLRDTRAGPEDRQGAARSAGFDIGGASSNVSG